MGKVIEGKFTSSIKAYVLCPPGGLAGVRWRGKIAPFLLRQVCKVLANACEHNLFIMHDKTVKIYIYIYVNTFMRYMNKLLPLLLSTIGDGGYQHGQKSRTKETASFSEENKSNGI